jgi:predicted DNA-binding transcriptional regulator YafY
MTDMSATLDILREAVRDGRDLWLGYVDAQGVASQLHVSPVAIRSGVLQARDNAHDEIRTFTLHRITSVTLADE